MNGSLLCSHLSPKPDGHFSIFSYQLELFIKSEVLYVLCRGLIEVVVHPKLQFLLGIRILNYLVRYPYLHILRLLRTKTLVGLW